MSELIESLTIKGFRGFAELHIPSFGKVNLITGKNNAGKSSLLEAIRILLSNGSPDTLQSILRYREELNEVSRFERSTEELAEKVDFSLIRSLFLNFPDISSHGPIEFSIQATGHLKPSLSHLTAKANWLIRSPDPDGMSGRYKEFNEQSDELLNIDDATPALILNAGDGRRPIPLRRLFRSGSPLRSSSGINPFGSDGAQQIRQVYLDPFSSKSTNQLGELWDAIALTDAQDDVLKALRLVAPDVKAVSMIGGDRMPRSRIAIVRSDRFETPIPLRSYGDGINRLFGIILSLCNARDGILLIDEFENGLHYSVQPLVWKTIFQLAKDMNVQVFATTHSRDCVHAFQEAANESPEEGRLIRLTRKNDMVIPTVFAEDELQIVAENDIEVR